ncbi:SGNH/GDSL hydrolase family protein [Phytohabitans kaempferiae]|uniref:SGNH/GDSL hydrolase family protein n=1 Tax=Phytohabitans kaempferiae TaxID=1620943 RepID=A0ABV6LX89_9ACTN
MRRRLTTLLLALTAIVALACEEGSAGGRGRETPKPSDSDLPSSMAALGDSISLGFGACFTMNHCQRWSWSTGASPQVDSHYRRLRADNKAIDDQASNYSSRGARAADLPAQVDKAVAAKVEYVTVLVGANDICRGTIDDMTPVADFRRAVDAALGRLRKGLPKAHLLVVSIPDLNRLWEVGHTEQRAVRAWSRGICPALLANPTSTAEADVSRRSAVATRVDGYNSQLGAACKAYGKLCTYDGGAAHRVRFTLNMINRVDWFHPDVDGQRKLAEVTYPRHFAA